MTNIQWTDQTVNLIHLFREDGSHGGHWCRKVNPLCTNCYAEAQNQSKFFGWASGLKYQGEVPHSLGFDWDLLTKWKRSPKPEKIFVFSMTDLFGDWVPDDWQFAVFDWALQCPHQTLQLLTKRPYIALNAATKWLKARGLRRLPPNLWMGYSFWDIDEAHALLQIPAAVHWLSVEPLIKRMQLGFLLEWRQRVTDGRFADETYNRYQWVVVGGESGKKARPMHPNWARALRDECEAAEVAFFFKQWGAWKPAPHEDSEEFQKYFSRPNHQGFWLRTDGECYSPVFNCIVGLRGPAHDSDVLMMPNRVKAFALLDGKTHLQFPQSALIQ